jgi:hypothetical protein
MTEEIMMRITNDFKAAAAERGWGKWEYKENRLDYSPVGTMITNRREW